MFNSSGSGLIVQLVASFTFPVGITLTQFAGDVDPFDIPVLQIRDKRMGLNGDLQVFTKAVPIDVMLSVVPGSDDDKNLSILLEANRGGLGKLSVRDVITLTPIYSDGTTGTLIQGAIMSGPPKFSVATDSSLKSKTYGFTFENTR